MAFASGERISKTQRWLDLIALLLGRRLPISVEEIMERVPAYALRWCEGGETARASARRAFERDKDELRAAGIPIETVGYRIDRGVEELEGYRISRGDFYLPYLRILADPGEPPPARPRPVPGVRELDLTRTEVAQAMEGLRRVAALPGFPFADEARAALRKLAFDIDLDEAPGPSVRWVARPGMDGVLERLRSISDALLARKRIRFRYHGIERGEATERDVAPYGLFFQGDWYLVGHAAVRDAIRVFRIARMESVEVNHLAPKRPDFEVPGDFRLRDYLDRSAWELGDSAEVTEVEVRFHLPAPGRVERFGVVRRAPFLRWILSQVGEAEIVAPTELREELRALARSAASVYAPSGGAHG